MKNKNHKQQGLKEQVHSEFETSVGNNFNIVREETEKKKKEGDDDGPLNQVPDEDSVKNEGATGEDAPKMNAPEEKKD